ncbi:MAG: hypothetical protein KDK91_15660, partial [Gammaproteobacteria bacterium]|nr:hypothetical protein [Gammaproteobacteria bacterium]
MDTSGAIKAGLLFALLPLSATAQFALRPTLGAGSVASKSTASASSNAASVKHSVAASPALTRPEMWIPGARTAATPCDAQKVYEICGTPAAEGPTSIDVSCSVDWGTLDCHQAA